MSDPFPTPRICFAVGQIRPCFGQIQEHHILTRHVIRKEWKSLVAAKRRGGPKAWSITKAIADERNKIFVCDGHHQLLPPNGASLRVEPHDLPRDFWIFVRDYDLQAAVPRHLAERWAA